MNASKKPAAIGGEADPQTSRLVQGIEKTRADMSGNLAALETRLSPSEIRGDLHRVEEKLGEVVREHLDEAKTMVKEELLEAKTFLREEMNEAEGKIARGLSEARDTVKKDLAIELENAEVRIRRGLADAKETVKKEVQEAVTHAKESARAATVGKIEDLATKLGDTMNDTRDTLIDTIRANPMPAAMAGIGLAWLLMNRSNAHRDRSGAREYTRSNRGNGTHGDFPGAQDEKDATSNSIRQVTDAAGNTLHHLSDATGEVLHNGYDAAGNALHRVTDAAGNVMHLATDAAGNVVHQASIAATAVGNGVASASSSVTRGAGNAASYVATGAKTQARRVEKGFQTTLEENPLALGVAAVAIGAAVGYALPRTHREDLLMGGKRDDLFRLAEHATRDAAGRVGTFAEKGLDATKGMLVERASAAKEA